MATTQKKNALNPKQRAFVREYLKNKGNGTQAAIKAGYAKNSAEEQASRLLSKSKVWGAVEAGLARAAAAVDVDLKEWLENAKELAFAKGKRDTARSQGLIILGKFKKWQTDRSEHTGADGGPIQVQIILPAKDESK